MIGRLDRLALDQLARIGDLASAVRQLISRSMLPLGIILALATGVLWFANHPGVTCFALVSAGTLLVLHAWRSAGQGLPIVPMLAFQNLVAYGVPIAVSNDSVMSYPMAMFNAAGIEILIFSCALAAAWRFGLQTFNAGSRRCYALQGFAEQAMGKLSRLGSGLALSATLYALLESLGLMESLLALLPTGSRPIVHVLITGMSACGFFLAAMMVGKGVSSRPQRVLFWVMLGLNCYILASAFLLSTVTTLLCSVFIGLFWGTGRMPWRYVLVVVALLSFLNLGKFEMRERYWQQDVDDPIPKISFAEMPRYYQEWADASFETLIGAEDTGYVTPRETLGGAGPQKKSGQSLLDRVNNLQNLLFVVQTMEQGREPLNGATYTLIPPLLVPRILWPEKPRSHEGQVMLNVHFGRQDLTSTYRTYVAWGLQAEAYGNFGAVFGNLLLGLSMGLIFAWFEKRLAPKLLLSMEGFLGFTLFLGMANSFEMVASVLVTSIFQSFFPIIIASWPFVQLTTPDRPSPVSVSP